MNTGKPEINGSEMERKELTSGEAEPVEYGYRVPFYSTMELFIETLTGTCFELRVSPFETVIAVKAKIQRLEGIPITQQYLIWQNMELEDEYCLHDYSITDGCTLKLVLAMRGGPINTRRIAMEEPTFREMADYVDANQDELFENLSTPPSAGNSGSNKQVTLLVYRDGDQLNFFRVVDRGDGTLTPLSESLSGGSLSNMEEEEDGEIAGPQKWSVSQVVENNITATKMKQLRTHMHNLTIKSGNHTNTKSIPSCEETPVPLSCSKDNPKLSVVRRHLTFSPKAINNDSRPLKTYSTKSGSSLGDLITTKTLPQQPPPSAEEKNLPLETALTADRQPLSQCEEVSSEPRSLTRLEEKLQNPELVAEKSKIAVKEANSSCSSSTQVHTASSKMTSSNNTITKTELLRARLNRIKQTMNVESKDPIQRGGRVLDENKLSDLDIIPSKLESTESSESGNKKIVEQSRRPENLSGKRSPRTQRLLAALSNNGKSTTTSVQSARKKLPAKTVPRFPTSLPQGMVFNRHDMYLRSYGLIASPDEDKDAEVVRNVAASVSDPVLNDPRVDEVSVLSTVKTSKSSKIMETPHGVQYTTPGRYSRQWWDRNPKTSVEDNSRTHINSQETSSNTVKEGSTKLENPSTYSLFHPYSRDLKPIGRPPQGHQPMPPPYPKLGSHEKSTALSLVCGTTRSKHSYSTNGKSASNWCLERSGMGANPSLVSNSTIHGKNNVRDKKQDKTQDAETEGTSQPRPSTGGISTLRYHGRWQSGNTKVLEKPHPPQQTSTNTTSGVRMNDSPHGKIETMSRQEAREVVDFINKAMDASILRSLVKSPGKETHRGSSGHSSFRHASLSHHHYGDTSRHLPDPASKYKSSNSNKGGSRVDISSLGGSRNPTTSAHMMTGMPYPPQSGLLPPVNPPTTKKKRCFLCGKKTGLATSYTCRCGNNFCATHRYAETHDCTYDYKTRGRKLLEENNPLVNAPKLPKI